MDESVLTDAVYTIETAIRTAAEQFERNDLYFGHGTDTALDEASWLILYAMKLSPAHEPDYARMLVADEIARCNTLLSRRIRERIPAAYITGEAWFAGHRFICDSRALVPRSPLAEFINHQFFGLLEGITQPHILDLCTGGGSIAIACAHAAPHATVHASDLSSNALALAGDNVALHQLQQQVRLFEGSLFEPLEQKYDLIISNPPYVDARDIAAMPEEFMHEPMMGLAAGTDGLDLVRLMLRDAAHYLKAEGSLVVEVGNSWQALEAAYPDLDFGWLEFTQGGDGVFVLTREELIAVC